MWPSLLLRWSRYVDMCCDLAGSVGNSGTLIVRYSQKKECIPFVFCCFDNLSIAITLEPLVRFRLGLQQNVPLLTRTSVKYKTENITCVTSNWFLQIASHMSNDQLPVLPGQSWQSTYKDLWRVKLWANLTGKFSNLIQVSLALVTYFTTSHYCS